ncbi:MAG: histone H1 [Gallionellaceae bacterium]
MSGYTTTTMPKRSSRLDLNQLAKRIVDEATGEAKKTLPPAPKEKNKAAQELGRLGGKKGGKVRAENLTPEQRSEIAKKAAQKRWAKN